MLRRDNRNKLRRSQATRWVERSGEVASTVRRYPRVWKAKWAVSSGPTRIVQELEVPEGCSNP